MAGKNEINRSDFFRRPKVREIENGMEKVLLAKTFGEIIQKHQNRTPEDFVEIGEEVNIIPKNEQGKDIFYSAQNFRKRGGLIELPVFSDEEMVKKEWTPVKARIEADKRMEWDDSKKHVGWFWYDPEGYAHIVHPSDAVEGFRIATFSRINSSIENQLEWSKRYSAKDQPDLIASKVRVPSKGKKEKYEITLQTAKPGTKREYQEWVIFNPRHECDIRNNDFTFRFGNKYVTYCPHIFAAEKSNSVNLVYRKKENMPVQIGPLFSEPLLRLHIGLVYHTIKRDRYVEGNKIHTKRRLLTFPEIDAVEMEAWKKLSNEVTFYAKGGRDKKQKLMRNYDWSIEGPGMPFPKAKHLEERVRSYKP